MVFSSNIFLYLFLPVVLLGYYILPKAFRNTVLTIASLYFYAWGEPKFVLIMLFSILLNYFFGLWISHGQKPKLALGLAVILNIGLLAGFKYLNFLVDNLNALIISLGGFPDNAVTIDPIPLPLGISFFTFHALSYIIDVYRKECAAQTSFMGLALYISLFPQLVAGPILRYHDIAPQIEKRTIGLDDWYHGVKRFIIGLSKKVLLANPLGQIADQIFAIPASELSMAVAWIGIAAYTLQIYYDFSGYSDMAIGLGRFFGFKFKENFDFPYIAASIKEFWRRWHISLSSWFRDYLYIPLGGNRTGNLRTYRNLIIVFFLTGLWHGASWNFVIWGLFHGAFLMIERRLENVKYSVHAVFKHVYVMLTVMIAWVFFRADTFQQAVSFIGSMFNPLKTTASTYHAAMYLHAESGVVFLLAMICCMPVKDILKQLFQRYSVSAKWLAGIRTAYMIGGLVAMFLCMLSLAAGSYNPFIYFRF